VTPFIQISSPQPNSLAVGVCHLGGANQIDRVVLIELFARQVNCIHRGALEPNEATRIACAVKSNIGAEQSNFNHEAACSCEH